MTEKRGEKRPRRRIMRALKINEISAVDFPAQQGAQVAIMKRDDEKPSEQESLDKRAALTTETAGHTHLLIIDREMGDGARPAGMTSYVDGHEHPWIMDAMGNVEIGEADGHTHEMGTLSTTAERAQELLMQKQEEATGRGRRRRTQEENVTDDAKKVDELTTKMADLEKQLKKSEAFGALPDTHKAYYNGLDDAAKDAFLAKSAEEQTAEVTEVAKAAAEANAVVYKDRLGQEYRKNDDPRLVAMAKQNDIDAKKTAETQEALNKANYEKRANAELSHFPGTTETKIEILKQIDGIEDKEKREEAFKSLRAQNAALSPAFTVVGESVVKNDNGEPMSKQDAEEGLAELAKGIESKEGISYVDAYSKAATQRPDLYEKAVAG